MENRLTFISTQIIERIENGTFVPARKSQPGSINMAGGKMAERRNMISPLNVTRRCVKYDPNVFHHRKDMILQMAATLNDPERKILLVGGSQGSGKTSLARAVIELMGSRSEQLLWFDVNRHTDFEEIIHFLIQYVTYICSALGASDNAFRMNRSEPQNPSEPPVKRLEKLINSVSHVPLLIVLDNVEYIVDNELRFNSFPFKEMLNFLLSFPNIKMMLLGERLPYADMSPNQTGVSDIKLAGLDANHARSFLLSKRAEVFKTADDETHALKLWQKIQGMPWLLKIFTYLNHHGHLDYERIDTLMEQALEKSSGEQKPGDRPMRAAVQALVRYVYEQLSPPERKLFQLLCFLRHPADVPMLKTMMGMCFPGTEKDAADRLDQSFARALLKVSYPPQDVLEHIRARQNSPEKDRKFKPWYELYHQVKRIFYTGIPPEERERVHGILQDFYLREKGKPAEERSGHFKNRALILEAKFHSNAARSRRSVKRPDDEPQTEQSGTEWIESKAYLYNHVKPLSRNESFTLDDYRNLKLPEDATPQDVHINTFEEFVAEPGGEKQTFQDFLADVELTDEERRILFGEEKAPPRKLPEPILSQSSRPEPEPETPPEPPKTALKIEKPADDFSSLYNENETEDEQEKAIQAALANAAAEHDKPAMARQLFELAQVRAGKGRYDTAVQCLDKALSLRQEAGHDIVSKDVLAEAYRLRGTIHKDSYRHNAALSSLTNAAAYIKRLMYEDDTVDVVWMNRLGLVYQNLGEIYAYRKQYAEAVDSFGQAIRWYTSADDDMRQAEAHFQLAMVYEDMDDVDNAIDQFQNCLQLDLVNGNDVSCAAALANLGSLFLKKEQYDQALGYYQYSLDYDRKVGNVDGQLATLDAMADIYIGQDELEMASAISQQGLTLAMQAGDNTWKATFYVKTGQVFARQDNWREALNNFEWAHSIAQADLSQESLAWLTAMIRDAHEKLRA